MNNLEKGKFYGVSKKQWQFNGITVVDSVFHQFAYCPWHYHQNAHFAFTTAGNLVEEHRSKKLHLSAGCLLYNHSAEPHCNSNYSDFVSAIHLDIDEAWFRLHQTALSRIEGVLEINNPVVKNLFYSILTEIKAFDNASTLSIEGLLMHAMLEMDRPRHSKPAAKPAWALKIKDLLYDRYAETISLMEIAKVLNIHPVYLCQQFPLYFRCSFGEYIRKIRIEKAVDRMLQNPDDALTEIAYSCGFSDQSHFTRLFKKNMGITPSAFRRMFFCGSRYPS